MEELLEILQELKPGVKFEGQTRLFDDGILDSLDVVSLVSEIDDAFDVEISVVDLRLCGQAERTVVMTRMAGGVLETNIGGNSQT